MTNSTEYTYKNVKELLDTLDIDQQVEVLANLFVGIGTERMTGQHIPSNISKEKVVEIVLDDVKMSGETLANSLARQGLIMLSWLDKEE